MEFMNIKEIQISPIKVVLFIILLTIPLLVYSDDMLTLIYKTQLEYNNYSFIKAKYYQNQMKNKSKFAKITDRLIKLEILFFERTELLEKDLDDVDNDLRKLLKKEKRDYVIESLKIMLNDIKTLKLANAFYSNNLHIDDYSFLLSVYQSPINGATTSTSLLPVYSYILFCNNSKHESQDIINEIYNVVGLRESEKEYLVKLNLSMYLYIEQNFAEAKELLSHLIEIDFNSEYYKYIEAMPYLWLSLISHNQGNNEESISFFEEFLKFKNEIDLVREFIVPLEELLSPMPGVFPPKEIYDELKKIIYMWENSKQ